MTSSEIPALPVACSVDSEHQHGEEHLASYEMQTVLEREGRSTLSASKALTLTNRMVRATFQRQSRAAMTRAPWPLGTSVAQDELVRREPVSLAHTDIARARDVGSPHLEVVDFDAM